jgi:hypothetical protein
MYIARAWLPVSFAGSLIKCLHFISMTRAFAQVRPHVAFRGRDCAPFGIYPPVGCVPAPVSNRLFLSQNKSQISPRNKTDFFCMTSCINFSSCAASCVPRALLLAPHCSQIYHCVHLRSLTSLTPWLPVVFGSLVAAPFGPSLFLFVLLLCLSTSWVSAFIVDFRSLVAASFNSSLRFLSA